MQQMSGLFPGLTPLKPGPTDKAAGGGQQKIIKEIEIPAGRKSLSIFRDITEGQIPARIGKELFPLQPEKTDNADGRSDQSADHLH